MVAVDGSGVGGIGHGQTDEAVACTQRTQRGRGVTRATHIARQSVGILRQGSQGGKLAHVALAVHGVATGHGNGGGSIGVGGTGGEGNVVEGKLLQGAAFATVYLQVVVFVQRSACPLGVVVSAEVTIGEEVGAVALLHRVGGDAVLAHILRTLYADIGHLVNQCLRFLNQLPQVGLCHHHLVLAYQGDVPVGVLVGRVPPAHDVVAAVLVDELFIILDAPGTIFIVEECVTVGGRAHQECLALRQCGGIIAISLVLKIIGVRCAAGFKYPLSGFGHTGHHYATTDSRGDYFPGGSAVRCVGHLRFAQVARIGILVHQHTGAARLKGHAGVFVGHHALVLFIEGPVGRNKGAGLGIVVNAQYLRVERLQFRHGWLLEEAYLGVVVGTIAVNAGAVVHQGQHLGRLVQRALDQALGGSAAFIGHFGHLAIGCQHGDHRRTLGNGRGCGIVNGEGIVGGEGQQLAVGIVDEEAHATRSSRELGNAVRNGEVVGAAHRRLRFILEGGVTTQVGEGGAVPPSALRGAVVLHIDVAGGVVIDEEYFAVFAIALCLDTGNDGIDVGLCLRVFGIGVVAHEPLVHHLEEAVGTEEFGEVFASGIAHFLIEVKQAGTALLVVLNNHGIAAQHLEEAGHELGVVAHEVVVEPEFVVHLGLCPNVVGEEVVSFGVVGFEHASKVALSLGSARGAATVVPYGYVREHIVGHFGQTTHIEQLLVLVADFMSRSPHDTARCVFVGHAADDVGQGAVVVVRAGPTTGHVARAERDGQTVHAVVLGVVNAEVLSAVVAGVGEDVVLRFVLSMVAGVGLSHLLLAEQSHDEAFAHHDAVPAFEPLGHIDTARTVALLVKPIAGAIVGMSLFGAFITELENHVASHDGEVFHHVALGIVVPVAFVVALGVDTVGLEQVVILGGQRSVGLCQVGFEGREVAAIVAARGGGIVRPEVIAHGIVEAVDVAALDVDFHVGKVREVEVGLIGRAVPRLEGLGGVVDAGPGLVAPVRNDVQALVQLHAVVVVAALSVTHIAAEIERGVGWHFLVDHDEERLTVIAENTGGVVQVGVYVDAQAAVGAVALGIDFIVLNAEAFGIVAVPCGLRAVVVALGPGFFQRGISRLLFPNFQHHGLQRGGQCPVLVVAGEGRLGHGSIA